MATDTYTIKRDVTSTEPTALSNRYLRSICQRLNATPRKCLDWKIPVKAFREKMMEEMSRPPLEGNGNRA